ncbi:hypothetical protein CISIN_1g041278mg, partial [Citrus sinensis]
MVLVWFLVMLYVMHIVLKRMLSMSFINAPMHGKYMIVKEIFFWIWELTAFATKLIAIILAIEHASIRDWTMLWIECDSPLTVHLCNKRLLPPWFLTHRWNN